MKFILSFFVYLRKIALCFWIGEMLFFIVIFAPRVFKILEKPVAAQLQASIFPAYYWAGLLCSVLVFCSLLATQLFGVRSMQEELSHGELFSHPGVGMKQLSPRRFFTVIGLTAFAGVIFAVSLGWITPEIVQLQSILYSDVVDAQTLSNAREQFDFLHKTSVQMNGSALLALLVLLFLI